VLLHERVPQDRDARQNGAQVLVCANRGKAEGREGETMKPRWRWALWCFGLELQSRWPMLSLGERLMICVSPPEWFSPGEKLGEKEPF
jgi:hypothetical protein